LNALIVNPTFDSQAKETLTTKPSNFGSSFVFSEKTLSAVIKSEIVDTILLWTQMKQQVELQKKLKGVAGRSGRDRVTGSYSYFLYEIH
jgi:DNA topoisomerase II